MLAAGTERMKGSGRFPESEIFQKNRSPGSSLHAREWVQTGFFAKRRVRSRGTLSQVETLEIPSEVSLWNDGLPALQSADTQAQGRLIGCRSCALLAFPVSTTSHPRCVFGGACSVRHFGWHGKIDGAQAPESAPCLLRPFLSDVIRRATAQVRVGRISRSQLRSGFALRITHAHLSAACQPVYGAIPASAKTGCVASKQQRKEH